METLAPVFILPHSSVTARAAMFISSIGPFLALVRAIYLRYYVFQNSDHLFEVS
jgi:hypothetical protein